MNKLHSYLLSLETSDPYFNVSYILMMLMMALLPFTTFFMWPIGVLLMLLCFFQGNWREKWENFKINDGIPYGCFLLGICLIPLLGFINSENMPIAWRTFECYIWFFFTPFIFLTTSPKVWKKQHFNVLLALFSIGELLYLAFLFTNGIRQAIANGNISYMYNNFFCYNSHHAYVALYATFVYILIFKNLLENQHTMPKARVVLLYFLEVFLAVGIFCMYSRAGILIFLIVHLIWSAYAIYLKHSRWKIISLILVIVFSAFAVFLITAPDNRFTMDSLTLESEDGKRPDPRLIIWQAAWDGAVENLPWGVGTGDGNDMVVKMYHENGFWTNSDHPYNAHNQFLFAMLTNGILGLILTILYFLVPFCTAIKHRDMMLFSIFLLLFFNCLVECMFDRRAGVDFFAIMIPLFIVKVHSFQHQQNSLT